MDKSVTFTSAELIALDAAAVWFVAELRARTDRADLEADREMSADQMNYLLDARRKFTRRENKACGVTFAQRPDHSHENGEQGL